MGCGKSKPANVATGNTMVETKKKPRGSVTENVANNEESSSSTSSASSNEQPGTQTVVEEAIEAVSKPVEGEEEEVAKADVPEKEAEAELVEAVVVAEKVSEIVEEYAPVVIEAAEVGTEPAVVEAVKNDENFAPVQEAERVEEATVEEAAADALVEEQEQPVEEAARPEIVASEEEPVTAREEVEQPEATAEAKADAAVTKSK